MAGDVTDVVRAEGFGLGEMIQMLEEAGGQFVSLLRSLDGSDGDRPIPNMTWTVAETAVHMLTIVRRGLGDRRRSDSVEGLAELNDQAIAEQAERGIDAIADLIEADLRAYVELLRAAQADRIESQVVRLHAGVRADVPTALSYQLFDLLAHGKDIATPTGRPWTISEKHATLALRASLPALRPWVLDDVLQGSDHRAAFTFPGFDRALVVCVGGGAYEVLLAGRDQAEAEVDPACMFLAISGRLSPDDPFIRRVASWFRPI